MYRNSYPCRTATYIAMAIGNVKHLIAKMSAELLNCLINAVHCVAGLAGIEVKPDN